jgi:hypothetical protein
MRAAALALATLAAATLGADARAATIHKVNKDFTRLIISLSSAELAALETDMPVVFEFGKEDGVASGHIGQINVVKKSAIIVLDAPDTRLKKKQELRFVSFFWNPILSPLMLSYSQYHQYSRSSVETALGLFGTDLTQKVGDTTQRTTADGLAFDLNGYLIFNPSLIGAGLGFDYREVQTATRLGDQKAAGELTLSRLEPGVWIEVQPHWRVSLRYDYTTMDVKYGSGDDVIAYPFSFQEPHLGLVWFQRDFEAGVHYKDREVFTAVDSKLTRDNGAVVYKETRKLAADLDFHFRDVVSPLFIWGGNLGYVFHERTRREGEAPEPEPAPYELLKLGTSFEHRLTQGSKLDWRLALEGAKVPTLATTPREVNTFGGSVAFYHLLMPQLVVGGMTELAAGIKDDRVSRVDPVTGETTKQERQATGYLFHLQVLARYDFDFGGDAWRRRR